MTLGIGWSNREMSERLMPEKTAAWLEGECLRRCRLLSLGRHLEAVKIERTKPQAAGRIGRLRHSSPNWTELRMKRRWLSSPIFGESTLSQEDGPLDSGKPRQAARDVAEMKKRPKPPFLLVRGLPYRRLISTSTPGPCMSCR